MTNHSSAKTVIYGAGTIGCYVGGHWAAAGAAVHLLGRDTLLAPIRRQGLTLDETTKVLPDQFSTGSDPSALAQADLVVLTLKSTALPEAIPLLRNHLPTATPLLCLLNGTTPVQRLRDALPEHKILAGMVPFNVVWAGQTALNRSSAGQVLAQDDAVLRAFAIATQTSAAPVLLKPDMSAIQHGKLLLNLNNPINALSGETLYNQLTNREFRQIYAATLREAIHVFEAANIPTTKVGPLPPKAILRVLALPDFLFNTLAVRVQKIDRTSMTSMAVDLHGGRKTEIDSINGEIVAIAARAGVDAPVNAGLVRLIKAAEDGGQRVFSAPELWASLGV